MRLPRFVLPSAVEICGIGPFDLPKGAPEMIRLRALLAAASGLLLAACAGSSPRFEAGPDTAGTRWFKGNTHTHTTRSDGDSEPEVVAQWYKDRGYDFLVLSDHNVLTDPAEAKVGDESFLLIPGEEVSATFRSPSETSKPIHVNALGLEAVVEPVNESSSLADAVQKNVDAIRAANAIPHVNHPNFRWAFTHQDLLAVTGYNLLEIHNGHPLVNNEGDATHAAMEVVWDILLTGGKRIYGIGVDDAHHFTGEFAPERSNPGRAWVMVRAGSLDAHSILDSLETGNFYFTTGVVLTDATVSGNACEVLVDPTTTGGRFTTQFIGTDGRLLAETNANPARYELTGDEMYVRTKTMGENGKAAWTQPAFVAQR